MGTVLSKDIKPATQRTSTSYSIRYRFTASNDRTYEGSSTIDVHDWERLVERGPVTVQYLVSDPSSSRLSNAGNLIFEVVFLVLGLALVLVGGYLVVRSSRALIEDWRLLRVGIEAPATVAAVEPTNLSINRRVQWEISYAYRDVSGKEHEGRSWTMPEGEARKFRPGDRGTIRDDPHDRPRASGSTTYGYPSSAHRVHREIRAAGTLHWLYAERHGPHYGQNSYSRRRSSIGRAAVL